MPRLKRWLQEVKTPSVQIKIKTYYGEIEICDLPPHEDILKIDYFYIKKPYRGKGYARKLARFLPKHCRLIACPTEPGGLNKENLVKFYKKLGFKEDGEFLLR